METARKMLAFDRGCVVVVKLERLEVEIRAAEGATITDVHELVAALETAQRHRRDVSGGTGSKIRPSDRFGGKFGRRPTE
jgi:hypothetical protein